jgi:hypothetical protein
MTHERIADDNYTTPPLLARWAVNHALRILGDMPSKIRGFEPACGDTAPFAMAMAQQGLLVQFQDLRPIDPAAIGLLWAREHGYAGTVPGERIAAASGEDYLALGEQSHRFRLVAANPPYKMAEQFVRHTLDHHLDRRGVAVFLLRLGFLESQVRADLFLTRPPAEVHTVIARPSFAHGGTDPSAYGIFIWLGADLEAVRRHLGVFPRLGWIDNRTWEPRRGRVRIEKGAEHGTP